MQELPITKVGRASTKGVIYRQLARTTTGYLYSANVCGTIRYEVFRRRIQKAASFTVDGNTIEYPERIQWPSDKHFGVWAWVYVTKNLAMDKLATI